MLVLLLLIPIFTIASSIALYGHNGKREILRFDFVQFIYAFVLAPVLFVWLKSFLFYLLRQELELRLSSNDIFIADTTFSVMFMYVYAFVVIHSLTKSFNLKRQEDPLYDLFHHSEYFHLWLTHVVVFSGTMLFFTLLSIVNVFLPLLVEPNRIGLYTTLGLGVLGGAASYLAIIWLYDPPQATNFRRVMKLLFGFFFLVHVALYFVFSPDFSLEYGAYWLSMMAFATLVACSLVFYRSTRAVKYVENLRRKYWNWNNHQVLATEE